MTEKETKALANTITLSTGNGRRKSITGNCSHPKGIQMHHEGEKYWWACPDCGANEETVRADRKAVA